MPLRDVSDVAESTLANQSDVQFYVRFWQNLSLMKGAQEEANLRQQEVDKVHRSGAIASS
jgi:hypothetical protein